MDAPLPEVPEPAAFPPPGGPPRPRGWLGLLLFLGVTLGLAAWCFARAASTYYLEVPMQTATGATTRMVYLYDASPDARPTNAVIVKPGPQPVAARFELRGQEVGPIEFDPTLSEGEVLIGTPVLRCAADIWLHRDIRYQELPLATLTAGRGVSAVEAQGDRLRIVCTDKDGSSCGFNPAPRLHLGFRAGAFARTFPLFAVVWVFLALLDFRFLGWRRAAGRWLVAAWPRLSVLLVGVRPALIAPSPPWEKWAVIALVALSGIVQCNAVLHHGSEGQDYPAHLNMSREIVAHPDQPWHFGEADPPLFYLINCGLLWLTGDIHTEEVIGLLDAVLNLAALVVFHRLSRRFVTDPVFRVALLTLVTFLPLRLIHSVVISADALTLLPFFVVAWALAEITDTTAAPGRRRWLAGTIGLVLTFGVLVKYIFMSALIAVLLTLLQLVRRGRLAWTEAALLGALALFLPLLTVHLEQRTTPDFAGTMGIGLHAYVTMSYADIFLVKPVDYHILRAPPYDEPLDVNSRAAVNGQPVVCTGLYELLYEHRHSFLALNHLAVFTDSMNIFQYDPTDSYFGQRSDRNQHLMALAVKTALPVTVAAVACVGLLSALALVTGFFHPERSRPDVEAVWLLAFGWFSNVVVFLPFVTAAYVGGYWTPRLTMPALLLFLLLTVSVLERLLPGKPGRAAAWLALGYVAGQSALQVCFLWPWGRM